MRTCVLAFVPRKRRQWAGTRDEIRLPHAEERRTRGAVRGSRAWGEASGGARTTKRPSDGLGGWGGQRSRCARDRALGRNRGLRWERSVGGPGRAEVVSPSTLGSVRMARPAGATSHQAPVDLGARSTVVTRSLPCTSQNSNAKTASRRVKG